MLDFEALRQRMVDNQIRPSEVTDLDLIRAFLEVPLERFVAPREQAFAYSDREVAMSPDAPGRRMLQPAQLARLIQALPLGGEATAMVIGCGSGYSAVILARLARHVIAVEEDEALLSLARDRQRELGVENLLVLQGRLVLGHAAEAPYDAILLGGGVEFVPDAIIDQLKSEGALTAIERNGGVSRAMLYARAGGRATRWPLFEASTGLLPGFERKPEFVF